MIPRLRASLTAFLADDVLTPALPAIAAAGSPQEPVVAISRMMTANAAFSAWVKPAAMFGGIHEPAAQDRRRSMEAEDLGLEPW